MTARTPGFLLTGQLGLALAACAWLVAQLLPAPPPPSPDHTGRSASMLRVITCGHDTAAASLAWGAAVADVVWRPAGEDAPPALSAGARLEQAAHRAGALDARFTAPWAYGALWSAAIGEVERSETMLAEATARFDQDPWFPWALGMSRLQRSGDREGAAHWLDLAGRRPGADAVHLRAAAMLRDLERRR